jgi:hypothetical protein
MKVSKLDRITAPVRELIDRWPLVHWGKSLFGPDEPGDEADGAKVGHMTLRRGPDGRLYGFLDAPKKEIKK